MRIACFCAVGNVFVEHFSAVRAEVPDPRDPATQSNTDLIAFLIDADGDPGGWPSRGRTGS